MGFWGPNTILVMVFGLENPIIWVLGPLGFEHRLLKHVVLRGLFHNVLVPILASHSSKVQ